MKFRVLAALAAAASLSFVATAAKAVTIDVTPASAPNVFGSPSYATWEANAIAALQSGASTFGTPGTPTYYSALPSGSSISVSDNIVTGFPSWKGQANPAAPFASELGNRLLFGLHIDGQGSRFSISQLSFTATSSDSTNSLGFSFAAGSYNYGTGYVGLDYVDGIKGNGNDVFITSGLNTQLVDELFGRGSGNAWAVYDTSPGATRQDKIDQAVLALVGPIDFAGTYSLGQTTGSASITLTAAAVPLPSAAGGGLALMAGLLSRRKWGRGETTPTTA